MGMNIAQNEAKEPVVEETAALPKVPKHIRYTREQLGNIFAAMKAKDVSPPSTVCPKQNLDVLKQITTDMAVMELRAASKV